MTCAHSWVVVGHAADPQPMLQLQCTFCLEVADLLPNPDEWDSYLRYVSDATNEWYHVEMDGRQPDGHTADECDHTWLVSGIADVDDAVMEIDGYLDLHCPKCGQRARILRPTYADCWQVTKDWLFDSVAYWRGEDGGRLVRLEDEPPPPAVAEPPQVRLALRRGNAGEFNDVDDQPRPPVADLVDLLDLFGGDDDDIPF